MTDDHHLRVEVRGADIVVSLPGTTYTVSYYKPMDPPQLIARQYEGADDPRAHLTHAKFLASAKKLANAKARELGWFV